MVPNSGNGKSSIYRCFSNKNTSIYLVGGFFNCDAFTPRTVKITHFSHPIQSAHQVDKGESSLADLAILGHDATFFGELRDSGVIHIMDW